jgi:hypothetical protein
LATKKTATQEPPSILLSPGKIVSIQSFKMNASKKHRKIMTKEYQDVLSSLSTTGFGRIVKYHNTANDKKTLLFIKMEHLPDESRVSNQI